jgi:hypothetical protein
MPNATTPATEVEAMVREAAALADVESIARAEAARAEAERRVAEARQRTRAADDAAAEARHALPALVARAADGEPITTGQVAQARRLAHEREMFASFTAPW